MILTFGKHKGKELRDVPPDYLAESKAEVVRLQARCDLLEARLSDLLHGKNNVV
jgi:hypothetical protein